MNEDSKFRQKFLSSKFFLLFIKKNFGKIDIFFISWGWNNRITFWFFLLTYLFLFFHELILIVLIAFVEIVATVPRSTDKLLSTDKVGIDHRLFNFGVGIVVSICFIVSKIKSIWLLIIWERLWNIGEYSYFLTILCFYLYPYILKQGIKLVQYIWTVSQCFS